ncbi:MAG: cytochrome b [Variibacter sp.]
MLRNTTTRWGSAARLFHWSLAVLIIGMLAYGWWMNHIPARPNRLFHRTIHADIGYLVLLLMVLRLLWRLVNPTPAVAADAPWQRAAAYVGHAALYGVTIVVSLLGWAHSGAHKPDYADWFGLFRVPQFTSENRDNARFFEHWHIYLAYALMVLIAIHIVAALYHHFIRRDRVMAAMVDGESTA